MKRVIAIFLTFFSIQIFGKVEFGIDQLANAEFQHLVKGKNIAVLAHFASRDQEGEHLVDLLDKSEKFNLVTIFAPEHGFRTLADSWIGDSIDETTGLPIYSLYRSDRLAPTRDLLTNVDTLVIDLQDVGMRFYTYSITMAKTMEACAENGVEVIVLDRLNPIGADIVEAPMLHSELQGPLMAYYPLPYRHGMTMGELALYYNKFFNIDADLHVIKMKNYKREMLWEDLDRNWIPSSPAIPSFLNSYYYAAFGILEAMNLAVGRGVDNSKAFTVFGAPWITNPEVAILEKAFSSFLYVTPYQWLPDRSAYKGKLSRGLKMNLGAIRGKPLFPTTLHMISFMKKLFGERLEMTRWIDRYFGQSWIRQSIENFEEPSSILERINADTEFQQFLIQRDQILEY